MHGVPSLSARFRAVVRARDQRHANRPQPRHAQCAKCAYRTCRCECRFFGAVA